MNTAVLESPVSCSDLVVELVKRWPDKEKPVILKPKLLFVDDNRDECDLFKMAFERYDFYDIFIASNGLEALQFFKEHQPFWVVFLDLSMPGMDGTEVFKRIREMNPLQYVVIVTGAMTNEYSAKLKQFLCYATAYKPVDFNKMAAILHGHINPPVS